MVFPTGQPNHLPPFLDGLEPMDPADPVPVFGSLPEHREPTPEGCRCRLDEEPCTYCVEEMTRDAAV
jgi:hypothetical protein